MKSWSKLVSAYEDALSGKSPLKVVKRDASPEMRKRKRNQPFNKELGLDAKDPETQWKLH
jgi:hypothetical protein